MNALTTIASALTLALALALSACGGDDVRQKASGAIEVGPCHIGGCSAQLCSSRTDLISTCEWRPEYACYRSATCEPQQDGSCGWTQSQELTACIAAGGPQ
ncbi:MAG TPA: hypothetical protein VND93_33740 [Myxococcales bacterium]|nr:hypothetical protein [Myxococcales bacterium]